MSQVLAYFLTFSTYGSRLHGDSRGSVNRKSNTPGTSTAQANPHLETAQRGLMQYPPVSLEAYDRDVVLAALKEVSRFRGWKLLAAHIRTQHVHVLVITSATPERVVTDFKARATRLLREAGRFGSEQPVWARHGSTRYVKSVAGLERAMEYTLTDQGEPMSLYDYRLDEQAQWE